MQLIVNEQEVERSRVAAETGARRPIDALETAGEAEAVASETSA